MKAILKSMLAATLGIEVQKIVQQVSKWSVSRAISENGYSALITRLRQIVPDISNQQTSGIKFFNNYWELKRRALQAFQCQLMLKVLDMIAPSENLTVVDVGDSAGTHMLYLRQLISERGIKVDTLSVNIDPRAIDRITERGLDALCCRAEELSFGDKPIDYFVTFEMVEHLHNPALFFRNLSKSSKGNKLVVTMPYLKNSRVGLHHLRRRSREKIYAEDEHIFELSPTDWELLMLHSGWKILHSEIYYQYPHRWLLLSWGLSWFWRQTDFEGFWGAILERDTTYSDLYQDWDQNPLTKRDSKLGTDIRREEAQI